ncbi:hypothetical protein [Enterococcus sp. AZ163]|uniref:hypothetical protein n=1 Tax=Enterococcus sp. AZ163 TaxID=2774638 RepID=UPI003D28BE92
MILTGKEYTSDEARDYFKELGLSYEKIYEADIWNLLAFISGELANIDKTTDTLPMKIVIKSVKIDADCDGLKSAFFEVSGPYFDRREGISFNRDGYIGFAGWASTNNLQPFIRGFMHWCKATAEEVAD